jgi:hypothetical protein
MQPERQSALSASAAVRLRPARSDSPDCLCNQTNNEKSNEDIKKNLYGSNGHSETNAGKDDCQGEKKKDQNHS